MEEKTKSTNKPVRDRLGNLRQENPENAEGILLKPSSVVVHDDQFWCVVCEDVINMTDARGGIIANFDIGGWMCEIHQKSR